MTERARLHLVDAEGGAVSPAIQEAAEAAFRWVSRDFPTLDKAKLADWAEAVAASMHAREGDIESPVRYAYAALKGKVRDWLRTRSAQEESSGIGRDLERLGGSNGSFQGSLDQKILYDKLQGALPELDRAILILLLNEKSPREVAGELQTSYPAARKAIQRVKERIGTILGSTQRLREGGDKETQYVKGKGLAVER